MKSTKPGIVAAALLLLAAACGDSRQAVGTVTSVIVIAPDSLWAQVGDSVLTALEPRIFTVRDERTFEVTHVAPSDPNWRELRRFRQVVAIGAADDAWVQPILEEAGAGAGASGVVHATDVWALNQFATALVLPSSLAAAEARRSIPQLAAALDSSFRAYAVRRMYTSGADTLLRDSLVSNAGYTLLLPSVYARTPDTEGVALFQNATQIGGDLIRSVLVDERPGLIAPTAEAALAWRDSIASAVYRPAQTTARDRIEATEMTVDGGRAVQVQGVWNGSDPTWPSSGPFMLRMVQCPAQDRTYLIDAWLFAPSRAKYEYMIQLETILDTFDCG